MPGRQFRQGTMWARGGVWISITLKGKFSATDALGKPRSFVPETRMKCVLRHNPMGRRDDYVRHSSTEGLYRK